MFHKGCGIKWLIWRTSIQNSMAEPAEMWLLMRFLLHFRAFNVSLWHLRLWHLRLKPWLKALGARHAIRLRPLGAAPSCHGHC